MRNPLRLVVFAAPVAFVLTLPAASEILLDNAVVEAAIQTWAAPPYWSPAPQRFEAADTTEREALASGRTALASGPVALPFIALPPCRVLDTRGGAPLAGGFLPPGTVRSYTLTGVCGIPANAQAVSLNATVVRPTGPGFLVLYAQGAPFPPVSTLNYVGNDVISNAALVPVSSAGGLSMVLGVSGGDVILDTNGYYAPAGVSSLDALAGDVTLAAGSNLTLSAAGNTLTLGMAPSITASLNGNVTGNLSGNVTGNVTGSSSSFTGPLGGNVTGTQGATIVSTVGGLPAASVASGAALANAATSASTANTIVRRDASGNFSAKVVTAEGGYQQPGTGGEILRTLRGSFTCPDATISVGNGFAVSRQGPGNYLVRYSSTFYDSAVVTVSLFGAPWGSTAVIAMFGPTQFIVRSYDALGNPWDFPAINFIAVGRAF